MVQGTDVVGVSIRWRTFGAAMTLLASVGLSGCVNHNAQTVQRDQRFLVKVHQAIPNISTVRSNTQLVRLGHAVCDAFGAGVSSLEIADRLGAYNATLPSQDLGAVMQSAVDVLCPRYRSHL